MLKFIFTKKTGFILLFMLLVFLGFLLVMQLPVMLYPQTRRPMVRITLNHAGYSAIDFADEYADKIEPQLVSIEDVDILEVTYSTDQSNFEITFNWNIDPEDAKSVVESTMNNIKNILPEDFKDNYRVRFSTGENAGFLLMGATSSSVGSKELYSILKSAVEPRFAKVNDVEEIEIYNVEELKVDITLNQEAMLAYGLTIQDVDTVFRSGYRATPVGTLNTKDKRYSIRFKRGISKFKELGDFVIKTIGTIDVTLKDIADIDVRYDLPRQVFVMEGSQAIRITATPVDGGNIKEMSESIQGILQEAIKEKVLPEDTQIKTYLDPATYINRSINNIVQAAVIGSVLAIIIIVLILGEVRNTVIIALSLPISLILSFILMYIFNISLNLISLGGIALAVGMIVDSTIVVMENIYRHYRNKGAIRTKAELKQLVIRATQQVQVPVFASTITSILVFFPISFTAPLTNAILGDQAKTVIFTLLCSLVVALTLIPVIAHFTYKLKKDDEKEKKNFVKATSVAFFQWLVKIYKTSLRFFLKHGIISLGFIAVSFGILIITIVYLLPKIPQEIIAPPASDKIIMFFRNSDESDVEKIVKELVPDLDQKVKSVIGEYILGTYTMVRGRMNLHFMDLKSIKDMNQVIKVLQKNFKSDDTWYFNISPWDPAQLPLPRTMDLQIGVSGPEEKEIVTILEQIRDIIEEEDLYGRTFTSPSTNTKDEIIIEGRDEILSQFQPLRTTNNMITMVRKIISGTSTMEFEEEGYNIDAKAKYPEEQVASLEGLQNFLIPYKTSTVPLKHFFNFTTNTGVSEINSENGERIFRVYSRLNRGESQVKAKVNQEKLEKILQEKLTLPTGYSYTFENPKIELDKAIMSLFVALAISIILIYLFLAFQFNSLIVPLVILVTVPLGFIGVILSLYVFNSTLSLNSMLGTILLGGIVVNNAIIMIDFYLKILPEHKDKKDAIVETAGLRFQPILITTLTTVCGMMPIAMGLGEGANIVQPLGIAVSGGLFISTLFTLYVIPCILRFVNLKGIQAESEI